MLHQSSPFPRPRKSEWRQRGQPDQRKFDCAGNARCPKSHPAAIVMTYQSRGRSIVEAILAVIVVGFLTGFIAVLCIGNYFRAKKAMERQRQRRLARLSGAGRMTNVSGSPAHSSSAGSSIVTTDERQHLLAKPPELPRRRNNNATNNNNNNNNQSEDMIVFSSNEPQDEQQRGREIKIVQV